MTVTAKALVDAKYAANAETTQYTAPAGVRAIVDKFTVTNVTAAAATITIKVVPSGGAAGATNVITQTASVAANSVYQASEMVGQILNAGDFISTLASALVIRVSGREITS